MDGGTLQQRVERMESGRQAKSRRVAAHPLFNQQLPSPEADQPVPGSDHEQVIMEAVLKALSGHYAQQAVTHAKKGGSLGKVLSAAKKKATIKKPVKKPAAKQADKKNV